MSDQQQHSPPSSSFTLFHGSATKDASRVFLAGSISGFLCKVLEYPLDTVKVIQQTAKPGVYSGPLDVAMRTVKDHGFLSLYKGLASPVLGSILENAFVFSAYKKCQHAIGIEENAWSSRWKYGLCGMGGGIVSSLVLTPAELIKCKLQIRSSVSAQALGSGSTATIAADGPWKLTKEILRTEGLRGMYRGHLACMSRELPGNFAWFGVYEALLRAICERFDYENRQAIPILMKSGAGSLAGMCYWAFPFPFDTAKSLLQTDARYRGMNIISVLSLVWNEQGLRGLYKGLPVTLVRAAPAHALIFFSFELVDDALKVW
ncbi:hypothetical protein BASA81_000361 [Batrachochytrium salamandrivorans]|nr:hypothetical protein BASA81_000361 [Batrachochytrium salamandrivorans]